MTRRDLVGTKHFRCPNAHAAAPSAHAHAGSAAIAASHRPASIAMAAAPPVTGPGVGAAAMAPHVRTCTIVEGGRLWGRFGACVAYTHHTMHTITNDKHTTGAHLRDPLEPPP